MSCQKLSDLHLWSYLDHELSPGERQAVALHLADCPRCADRLDTLRQQVSLTALPNAKPPPGFQARVMARVAAEHAWRPVSPGLAWAVPGRTPIRLVALTSTAVLVSLTCIAIVGAGLASPALLASDPSRAPELFLTLRRGLFPLQPVFQQWGWAVLVLGMLAAVALPLLMLLAVRARRPRP